MSEWVTITEAAIRLEVGTSKISRLLKQRPDIPTMDDPVDRRVKLVDFEELKKLFERHVR